MAEDKVKMPADGSGTEMRQADENGELASRRDAHSSGGLPNAGESGGGAYPNPHSERKEDEEGGFHGGQSQQGYYGKGQLGDKDVGETENAPSKDD
jgi:hypothetical protein